MPVSRVMLPARLRLCFVLGVVTIADHPMPASAQDQQGSAFEQRISDTDAAALLIQAGRLDDAKRVLAQVLAANARDYQAIFLRGMIAVAEKNYTAAIADFRRILADEPNQERVRLELARTFFLDGDYANAERNFRFARAGRLPPEVNANIDQYLAAILRLKRWSYDIGVTLAQDTNVNGATSVREIDLFGLPFTLSDNARAQSGLGIAIDVGGEWSPSISANAKARLGGHLRRLDYGNSGFDDMTASAYAGPEILFRRWQIAALMSGFQRWYGNVPYAHGIGGRTSVTFAVLPRVRIGATLDTQSVIYRPSNDQSGWVNAAHLDISYAVSTSALLRLSGGLAVQNARLDAFANNTRWFALSYYRDLPFAFSASFEPAFSWTDYDTALAAFGTTRADSIWALRLDVLNRRVQYAGFAPRLSIIHAEQSSTIALYRYQRTQLQLGLSRQF